MKRLTKFFALATIGIVTAVAGGAIAQMQTDQKSSHERTASEVDGPDNAFIVKAANSGMFEIESSKIAVKRAKDAEVKKFAQQMVTDHTKADAELKKVAGTKVPAKPDEATLARIEKINAASDDKFDAVYVAEQRAAHDEAVSLFTKASKDVADPELKAFAEKTLPTLEQHQEHIKALDAK